MIFDREDIKLCHNRIASGAFLEVKLVPVLCCWLDMRIRRCVGGILDLSTVSCRGTSLFGVVF